jgi:hypothetical protein
MTIAGEHGVQVDNGRAYAGMTVGHGQRSDGSTYYLIAFYCYSRVTDELLYFEPVDEIPK